jgi:hypothetical protein
MRRIAPVLILTGAFALPLAAGCAETISEDEKVTTKRDGTVKVERETVKRQPDGSITREKEVDFDRDRR